MLKGLRRKPSPAMVVAVIAVILGLAGTAPAARKLLSGSQIKKNSIAASKLTKHARKKLRGSKGPEGPKGDKGDTGEKGTIGDAGLPATKLWAVVRNVDGTPELVRGGGAVSVTDLEVGVTRVVFSQSVADCGWLATVGQPYLQTSSAGIATVERGNGLATVTVRTFNPGAVTTDFPFHLAVFC